MWLFVVCSLLSDVLLMSVIVLDCAGLQDVGGPLLWACLGERFCELVQLWFAGCKRTTVLRLSW